MMKITLSVAAATVMLTTAPLITPTKAQGIKMAQVDMQTGRHFEDRDPGYYRERRGYDSNATVGVGPGGVTIGPRQRCRMGNTTFERDDGRRVMRRERVCNSTKWRARKPASQRGKGHDEDDSEPWYPGD